jgi:multidrug efflux pump
MTSFAFILGVVPLVVATGAGAEMRRSLGTAVFSGMLGVTLFGVLLTPVFFSVIQGLSETPLLESAAVRWGGSALLGALVGAALGYLLSQTTALPLSKSLGVGFGAGAVLGLLIPAIERRFAPNVRPGPHTTNGARP